jgi:hypothetical protein
MTSIKAAVGSALIALTAWCAMVGFNGGRIPVFGNHVRGSGAHGLLWLFMVGSFAFGIFEVIALGIETAARTVKRVAKSQGYPTPQGR